MALIRSNKFFYAFRSPPNIIHSAGELDMGRCDFYERKVEGFLLKRVGENK